MIIESFFIFTSTPASERAFAIELNRSLSLNFNSSNPENTDVPLANEAATNSTGNSSISLGIIFLSIFVEINFELETLISPIVSSLIIFLFSTFKLAFIFIKTSNKPVL